jgi:MFS family permease
VWGGWQADRTGRERLVIVTLVVSGSCSLGIGLCYGASPWLLAPIAWLWGFFVVADSAQFSTLVTELAPRHAVGTALTLQTSVGFLLTVVTIQGVPAVLELVGWRWAFAILALGPAAGIFAMRRLARLRTRHGRSDAPTLLRGDLGAGRRPTRTGSSRTPSCPTFWESARSCASTRATSLSSEPPSWRRSPPFTSSSSRSASSSCP